MNMKRIFAAAIGLAMLSSLAAGCGGAAGSQAGASGTAAASATTKAAVSATTAAASANATTAAPVSATTAASVSATTAAATAASATTASSGGASSGANKTPASIVMERPFWGNFADPSSAVNLRIQAAIAAATGITCTLAGDKSPSDQTQKPNLMLASGEKLDIFQVPSGNPANDWQLYKAQGAIQPLNDLLSQYGQDILANIDPTALKLCTDSDGKIWAVPEECHPVVFGLMMRKDWLDAEGLSAPTVGTSLADFEAILQVFHDKHNDQGFATVWGPSGDTWTDSNDNTLLGTFIPTGDQNWVDPADNKLKPAFLAPGFKDYLTEMQKWYQKGWLNKEFATITYDQSAQAANGGQMGLWMNWMDGPFNDAQASLRQNVPDASWVLVPPPAGPNSGGFVDSGRPIDASLMITASSADPAAAMRYLNYTMGTKEGWLLSKYGQEGTDYTWADQANGVIQQDALDPNVYHGLQYESGKLLKVADQFQLGAGIQTGKFMMDPAKYSSKQAIDLLTVYDKTKWKSADQLNALASMIATEKYKIIMGQAPVSDWDNTVTQWLAAGGQQMIDDQTAQFNAQKTS